jgi:hypothetical protein
MTWLYFVFVQSVLVFVASTRGLRVGLRVALNDAH